MTQKEIDRLYKIMNELEKKGRLVETLPGASTAGRSPGTDETDQKGK